MPAIAAACSDPEIARWTRVPSPYTREDAHAWIALSASMLASGRGAHLVIAAAADDRLLGSIGLELGQGAPPRGEIGYWVAAAERGRGVGSRAVRLMSGWALGTLGLGRLEIAISPCNEASRRLAGRAGYAARGRDRRVLRGRAEDFEIWVLGRGGVAVAPVGPGDDLLQ